MAIPSEIFDLSDLRYRAGYDEELVLDAVQTFLASPNAIPDLCAAVKEDAFEKASRGAHRVKGSLLALGAKLAATAAGDVERIALETKDRVVLLAAIDELAFRLAEACDAMKDVVANAKPMTLPASCG